MKIGQLHLNGGMWNGRRIYTTEWSSRAVTSHSIVNKSHYGYLWWITQYPYKGRNLIAYFASGNGGQTVITIPELDLVMAFYGGNYSDAASARASREYVPKYILPAMK
jgi:CubicO group peptidase (beta-lactamase class C family)